MPTSPSLFLLDRFVKTYKPDDCPDGDRRKILGRVITSEDKQAFGFGADKQAEADSAVQGLELVADLAGLPGCCSLSLRGGLYACIHAVDKDLILIASDHPKNWHEDVLLIYNAIDRSLRMIPTMPRCCLPITFSVVLVARKDDKDKSYALVFPGTDDENNTVLYVSPSSSKSPWSTVKKANFPSQWLSDGCFRSQVVFSFRGRGYWVDLLFGIMYCELADVLSEDVTSVDIKSIRLPVGCLNQNRRLGSPSARFDARAIRAMGPVGDSIIFVSIDFDQEFTDDTKVSVWRLMEDMNWDLEYELTTKSLLEGVEFKWDGAIPSLVDSMALMFPRLNAQEDHVIYLALGHWVNYCGIIHPTVPFFLLRVDLSSKTSNCTAISPEAGYNMAANLALYSNSEGKLLGLQA